MTLLLGLLIIAIAVYAEVKRVDVRLALLLAGILLGVVGGNLVDVVHKFFATLTDGKFIIPICTAMGFAYALRHSGCDQHLVHLLTNPLRRLHFLLIPGAVMVAFLVNIPIISQTSTAVAVGAVLVPLLLAARVSPETTGAALLLGASIGGELLNPGAPEFRSIIGVADGLKIKLDNATCGQTILPLLLVHVPVAVALFWWRSQKIETAWAASEHAEAVQAEALDKREEGFQVDLFKAIVPFVPLALLIVIGQPLRLLPLPENWLAAAKDAPGTFDSRLIGATMIVGVVFVALAAREHAKNLAGVFFEGAGYAYANIISIIVAATCFGEGVKGIGLDKLIGDFVTQLPGALIPLAGFVTMGFGFVCGSGMAATQSMAAFFMVPGHALGLPPELPGSVVAIGAAAGRTMSLVAAVTLMCSQLTNVPPHKLVGRVAAPLAGGMLAMILFAMFLTT